MIINLFIHLKQETNFQCSIPELVKANWTIDQIDEILPDDPCRKYDHNYTHLVKLGYNKALKFVKESEFSPNTVSCPSFIFNNHERSTIVDEVCI